MCVCARMCVHACVYVCACGYVYVNAGATEPSGIIVSGTGVLGSCELPDVCWEPDMGPLKEQQVLLNTER